MVELSVSNLNENKFVTGGMNKVFSWIIKGNSIELENEINLDSSGFVTGISHI
jgi:hypothetical protein